MIAMDLKVIWEMPVKIGAKVVRHGRYVTFQLAEVAVPRDLFRKILSLIDDLRRRPIPAQADELYCETISTIVFCKLGACLNDLSRQSVTYSVYGKFLTGRCLETFDRREMNRPSCITGGFQASADF